MTMGVAYVGLMIVGMLRRRLRGFKRSRLHWVSFYHDKFYARKTVISTKSIGVCSRSLTRAIAIFWLITSVRELVRGALMQRPFGPKL
jgi:hypothetical protein